MRWCSFSKHRRWTPWSLCEQRAPRIDSYHGPEAPSLATPDLFLKQVTTAEHSEAKAIGEGADLRFDNTAGIAGGALMARDRLIHLCAFAWAQQAQRGSDRVYRRHYM